MPTSIEDHIKYARNELNNWPYYVDMFKILADENIESYLDIGANVGEFGNIVAEKLPTIKMSYLIEPEEDNFKFLVHHVKARCLLFNVAIGYGSSSCSLARNSNIGGASGHQRRWRYRT